MKTEYVAFTNGILKECLRDLGLSRSFLKKVKLSGKMYLNGKEVKNFYPVKKGDLITLEWEEQENLKIVATDHELDIRYEDEHYLVINKEHSLAVQPSRRYYRDNTVSYVKGYFALRKYPGNVHVVNRLDYATSGLMIVAKDGFSHFLLKKNFPITRKYLAVTEGIMTEKEGIIDLPIRRETEGKIKRIVAPDGKEAKTAYKVISEDKERNLSLVDINLITGRTHQIRVHFATIGHPVLGDRLYGKDDVRLFLHCYFLSFKNPYNGTTIEISCPPDFYRAENDKINFKLTDKEI